MRLIDADALIEDLKRIWGRWDEDEWYEAQAKDALKDDVKIVNEQPTVPYSPRWHRVEDGLPDKYTQCLVADANGKCAVGYYRYDCEAWDSPAFGWIEAEDRIYIDDIPMGIGKVVAWMPLPEPPKEDA